MTLALVAALLLGAAPAGQLSGRFKPAGSLSAARVGHTATLLKDGRVLIVGGRGADGLVELKSVELWDPRSNRWKAGAALTKGRSGHTATLLADGRVLVAGGTAHEQDRFIALESAELYDPKTGKWAVAAPMAEARNSHTATLMPDGTVVVVGGVREQKGTLASCERYDPKANAWKREHELNQKRSGHRAVLLIDDTLLVVGGRDVKPLASVERLGPPKGDWSFENELSEARQHQGLVTLADGTVMVLGGLTPTGLTNVCELWRPGDPWKLPEHSFSMAHASFAAVTLKGGDVLVTGGEAYATVDTPLAQRFLPGEQKWCVAGKMSTSRKNHTATLLDDGHVLVVGGTSAGITEASAELWESAAGVCDEPAGLNLEP